MDTCLRIFHLSVRKRFGILLILCATIILIQLCIVYRMDRKLQSTPSSWQQTIVSETMTNPSGPHLHRNTSINQDNMGISLIPSVPRTNSSNDSFKTIILYDFDSTLFEKPFRDGRMTKCEVNDCTILNTSNMSDLGQMRPDAVLVQANRVSKRLSPFKSKIYKESVFIFMALDPPGSKATRHISKQLNNRFNWTMTYRINSDIPLPHGAILPIKSKRTVKYGVPYIVSNFHNNRKNKIPNGLNKNYHQLFRSKRSEVAWIQDICSTDSKSEDFVKMLQNFIKVDIYGNCSSSVKRRMYNLQFIARDYKFLLIFEETMCVDYISKPVFSWFRKDIVLVLRGAGTYAKQIPVGTYIDTNEYESPRELGTFLTNAANEERIYTAFLRRKSGYHVIEATNLAEAALCEICKRLNHVDRYRKSVKGIDKWWRNEQHCVYPYDIYPFKPVVRK